jgi:hypothetical protein
MGVCSGRRPSGRRWGMGVCRPGNTPARGGYGRYEAIQPDFAPETGARRRNFRPQCITSDDFPRLEPPPSISAPARTPPPLCALRAATRPPPVVSLSRKHFHDMGEWDDPPLRFKVKGDNVSYVRYMQVWSLRGMGVCSGRRAEARMRGTRVCR